MTAAFTIRLDDDYYKGKTFVIETQGEGDYVQQYKLNGEELHATRLPFSDFARGGKLQVTLGTEPKDQY